ncbi:MAG TPA: efflux RND transporter permease subunit [Polyangiaceae bacterium]|nr:efflux RND transporter permease subunit [Polyangiaceae bacterium]
MIAKLLQFSLSHRWLVFVLSAVLLLFGGYRALHMPVDVFPDLAAPRVTVVTESGALASEEVERLVTLPIESAVNGVAGVRRVRSGSSAGISLVWVEFDWDTDAAVARQRVNERLQGVAASLPEEVSAPVLAPASSVMGEIAFVALRSDKVDARALRRVAETEVRRRLLGVEGIAQVVAIGGEEKQLQVIVDPQRLELHGLTQADVSEALRRGSQNAPGGYVVDRGQEAVVRVLGRATQPSELEAITVASRDGSPVRVRDVADVRVGSAVARGTASYGAHPAVILSVVKQPHADTLGTTRRMDQALDGMQAELRARGIEVHRDVFRQQDFIDRAIDNLFGVLRDGALLVVVVLFAFLWSVRPTLISVVAIPLSLVVAALVLDALGFTIDTMTLGGLAIAIGELVDDAIVDVDNVVRRLRERQLLPEAERPSRFDTVLGASLEIRSSIVSATYIVMLVFLPLLFLEGLEGRLLRPLAVSYLVAIFASLVVAVTVTPALCLALLPRRLERASSDEPPLVRYLLRRYEPVLTASLRHPRKIAASAFLLVAAGAAVLAGSGRSFLPEFNEGSLTINMVLAPGTALAESDALARMAERALLRDNGVAAVGRRTGRAERDEHVLGVETSEFEVRLKTDDPRTREQLMADIRERLKIVPGAFFEIGQPISHRIEHMISGQRSALSIKVFGDDLRELRRFAKRVESTISAVPGLVDVQVEQVVEVPELVLQPDPGLAAGYGLSAGAAAESIGAALWGSTPTHVYDRGYPSDVVVKYAPEALKDAEAVRRTLIVTPSKALVPVSALADVRSETGPNMILRENVERRVVVTANVAGRDILGAYREARQRIERQLKPPAGLRLEYAGQFEREQAAGLRLLALGALCVFGIGLIVAFTLKSVRRTLIVLVNLPLALAGGVIGVVLAGGVLSVATTIGFITLFGIATRNGILLATRMRDLELEGRSAPDAAAGAARERLAPILMTAVTAALGLLPLALALGRPGSEIQAPMALVILTGLLSSTALNMLVVPSLLARWGGKPA